MKPLLSFICFLHFAYCFAQTVPSFSIKPRSKSTLKISYTNNNRVRTIFTQLDNVLPYMGEVRLNDSLVTGTNAKYISYELASPQRGFFAIDNLGASIYLVPDDTLTLFIDLSQPNPWLKYRFEGIYSEINKYYFDQARVLKVMPTYSRAHLVNEAPNLFALGKQLDSLKKIEINFLKEYKKIHRLPDWFIKNEQQQIFYSDANCRVNAILYRQFIKMDSLDTVPKEYLNFITAKVLNDSSAAHLPDYQNFLSDYFSVLQSQEKHLKSQIDYVPTLATKYLSGLAWDIFMARYLDRYLAGLPTEGEKLLAKYAPKFFNQEWITLLKLHYEDAYTLKPGEQAPNFVLEDKMDSLAYLKDFQGQVIYLSFWFTGCAPCRQEIPYENKLAEYFKDKPVKIVTICVKSSRENWAKVSELYNLQTINLYANKAWENTLINKYNVKAYPHYVLIDQTGKVAKNNCSRPSNGAKEEIEILLSK